jgi:hypothetical protein
VLGTGQTYTTTVRGGSAGAKDSAGNALANDVVWSFTTVASTPSGCPCSLWDNSAVPAVLQDPDSAAVELGVKFQSNVAGQIRGIRFYKSTGNTGTHLGSLWNAAGQRLAQATFTGETASGWQTVLFQTPIAITANTTYVASYHTNVGRYSTNENYFTTSGFSNGPLRALADNEQGRNGPYRYGASAFPNSGYQGTNYWVDIIFVPN